MSSPSGFRAFAASSWAGAALVVLCLAVYLPGFFSLPAVDRDESRFAQASRQMAETGDYAVPRVQDRARLNKPPFIYWAQALSALAATAGNISRDAVWMYRLPSLFAAIAVVLLTRRIGLAMFDPRAALLAAVFIAVAPVFAWEARQARADMAMVAFTTAAMLGLWLVHSRGPTTARLLLFWTALALGILTKGPIPPLVAGLAAVSLSAITHRWRWLLGLAPVMGVVIIGIVCLPWLLLVIQEVGPEVYWRTVLDETVGRSVAAKEGHWGPPGYHLAFLALLLFPGSLCVGAAVVLACRHAWHTARTAAPQLASLHRPELFLLAWALPSWLLLELVGTKLPHYTMPLYPALALLAARLVTRQRFLTRRVFSKRWIRPAVWLWRTGAAIVACGGIAALTSVLRQNDRPVVAGIVAAFGLAATVAAALLLRRAYRRGDHTHAHLIAAAITGVGVTLAFSALPHMNLLWTGRSVAALIERHDPRGQRPVGAVGYQEDSLIFETRGRVRRLANENDGAAWLAANPGGMLVIEERLLTQLPHLRSLGGTAGFNYAQGRWVHVALAESPR